ncbi:hypothetical protein BDV38DRAFT_8548 [Aspergillus pseudotamarii]|uniref:Uncharacterized protein n=1 Tax=Aspergillus pseudotamarii TaxID=132259 RepID=A0A5N6T343_ASPPS|nr:uncharacterized protein BDV38DRAFT_8548 [Aspergillus pseudotamarii]KAE8140710.1 hypothetical protein BDV38DRAFT_8548 [Aspergillus pseudotamarii]
MDDAKRRGCFLSCVAHVRRRVMAIKLNHDLIITTTRYSGNLYFPPPEYHPSPRRIFVSSFDPCPGCQYETEGPLVSPPREEYLMSLVNYFFFHLSNEEKLSNHNDPSIIALQWSSDGAGVGVRNGNGMTSQERHVPSAVGMKQLCGRRVSAYRQPTKVLLVLCMTVECVIYEV